MLAGLIRTICIALGWLAAGSAPAADMHAVAGIVQRHVQQLVSAEGAGGAAVAVRIGGQTLFFNFGMADAAAGRPVTSDTLFNLGSVAKTFEALLLAQAAVAGDVGLDDPVAMHVPELQEGADIRRVTLRQLAAFTTGLHLPQDFPPWPTETHTRDSYIETLKRWRLPPGRQPGGQVIHAQSGYILLRLALERRLGAPYGELMRRRILEPLGLASTILPVASDDPAAHPRGVIPAAFVRRAVQGYDPGGSPIGRPGDLQGYYHWLGTGQMYASARDMAVFLAAQLGELPGHETLQEAMRLTQRGILPFGDRQIGAMAWERRLRDVEIVERFGGLNNASATLALVPSRGIGVVILCNRGSQNVAAAGRAILLDFASP